MSALIKEPSRTKTIIQPPTVTVVIPTLNRIRTLLRCVDELLSSQSRHLLELIIVDQSDKACHELANHADSRIHYHHVTFRNLPRARNCGVAVASAEIVLFLDDDVEGLGRIVDAHAIAHARTGADVITGPTLRPGQSMVAIDTISSADREKMRLGQILIDNVDACYTPLFAPGCNASYRRRILLDLDGFDENFIGSAVGEDADMTHRVKMNGGTILYDPAASLVHLQATTGGCRNERNLVRRAVVDVLNTHYFWHKIGLPSRARKAVLRSFRTHVLNGKVVTSLPPWSIARRLGALLCACWTAHGRTARLIRSAGPRPELQ